jgi:hypothetical protein
VLIDDQLSIRSQYITFFSVSRISVEGVTFNIESGSVVFKVLLKDVIISPIMHKIVSPVCCPFQALLDIILQQFVCLVLEHTHI